MSDLLIAAFILIFLIAGMDQWIKLQILENFALYQEKEFLKIGSLDILHLRYIENNGSAFSSFSGQTTFLLIVSAIGILICSYLLIRYGRTNKLLYTSLVMILGGASGNLIDRIFRDGRVVDYLDLQLFDFAIFNFADCFVTVGTVLLLIYILFFMDRQENPEKSEKPRE
ncbi:MAG: signal peptidase II [Oscillospiraceae bacterium]|nr:signal peptidase II [Oscillospiraceae bacterium]